MQLFEHGHFVRLLARARTGCRQSLGELLQPFRMPLIINRQSLELPPKVEIAELLQETFHEAVASFERFGGKTEGELYVWLRQIMNGCAGTMGRRYLGAQKRDVRREISLEDPNPAGALRDLIPDDELTPYSSTSAQERRRIFQQAFEKLNQTQKLVIQLHHNEGKSFPEIAAILGKTTKAVTKTWERALKAWRAALASLGVEEDS